MPNHCENDLYLRGSDTDIAAVLDFIGMDRTPVTFDFNALIPYPDPFKSMDDDREAIPDLVGVRRDDPEYPAKFEARRDAIVSYERKWGTTKDGYNSGGYEWCCKAWGTKWNAYDVVRRDYDGRVCITFQTAWAPPIPVILELARRFPTITFDFEYFERGMEYAGGFQCPSEDDWYDDNTPWQPGAVIREWEMKGYRGSRGG